MSAHRARSPSSRGAAAGAALCELGGLALAAAPWRARLAGARRRGARRRARARRARGPRPGRGRAAAPARGRARGRVRRRHRHGRAAGRAGAGARGRGPSRGAPRAPASATAPRSTPAWRRRPCRSPTRSAAGARCAGRSARRPPGRRRGGHELRRTRPSWRRARATDAALEAMRPRVRSPRMDTLVAACVLQRRAGGDLAGLLRDSARAIEDQARLEDEVRSATAQARFTAMSWCCCRGRRRCWPSWRAPAGSSGSGARSSPRGSSGIALGLQVAAGRADAQAGAGCAGERAARIRRGRLRGRRCPRARARRAPRRRAERSAASALLLLLASAGRRVRAAPARRATSAPASRRPAGRRAWACAS